MSFSSIAVSFIVAYGVIGSPILHTATGLSDTGNSLIQVPKATKKPEQVKQLKSAQTNSPPSQSVESPSKKLIQCLRRFKDSRTGQSSGTGAISSNNSGSSMTENPAVTTSKPPKINSIQKRRRMAVGTTTPIPPKINTSNNNRPACRNCNTQYPVSARQQNIEGRMTIAVDADAQGNVTNVRLVRSSGNSDLDAETLRQAQNWKFKPASNGRQGVTIATEYAITGSCRYQQLQERQRQRSF